MIAAIVLAGGVDRGEIAAQTGVIHRPLLEVGGRPILLTTLAALRGAAAVATVTLVGPEPVQAVAPADAVDARAPEGDTFLGSITQGLAAAPTSTDHLLLITSDLPLITAEAIDDFVRRSLGSGAEVCYPIIPKDSCERRFPGGRRTYVRLREGTFTGGNAVLTTRSFLERSQGLIARLYAARKNPLKLATLFGLPFLLGLLTGRLTIPQLEARASAIISGQVAAIISHYPELGFDVDKVEDLEVARRAVGG
jgi:GTP:adenosylcobinamide-phosphate guanylyltransferase